MILIATLCLFQQGLKVNAFYSSFTNYIKYMKIKTSKNFWKIANDVSFLEWTTFIKRKKSFSSLSRHGLGLFIR